MLVSTTTKLVLIDTDKNLLYSDYKSNEGNPLNSVIKMLKSMYEKLPETARIRFAGVTGYGRKINSNSFKCWFKMKLKQ